MKFLSCDKIEYGINFDRDSVKICCQYSSRGGGTTVVFDNYKGEPIDWDKYFAFKEELKTLHKSGKIYHKCEGCIYLIDQEWEEENKIKFFNTNI